MAYQTYDLAISANVGIPLRLREARNGRAMIASMQRDFETATIQYQAVFETYDKSTEPVDWAKSAANVAKVLFIQAEYKRAEPLLYEVLRLREENLGPNHVDTAKALNQLAMLMKPKQRWDEAERLQRRALAIHETALGKSHPAVAMDLYRLAELLQFNKRPEEAEPLHRRAVDIERAAFGEPHPVYARGLYILATFFQTSGRLQEAEPIMLEAMQIMEYSLTTTSPFYLKIKKSLEDIQKKLADPSPKKPIRLNSLGVPFENK